MRRYPHDWWDGIGHMDQDESESVRGDWMDFSLFFLYSAFVLGTAASLHPNPHACRKSQCNWWSLCVSMYTLALKLGNISPPEIERSWQQLSGSQSAGKPTGFYVLSCTELLADPQPPPVSLSLALASKDLCGPRRQESLILRLGGPYTVLLHILHAYVAGHRERPLSFLNVHMQGRPHPFSARHRTAFN